jgi:hypothetical protein
VSFTLNFNGVEITASSLPNAAVGSNYSDIVLSTGGTAPFAWTANGLPAGLSLNPQTGLVTGSASGPGTFSIDFNVTSADGSSARATLTLIVFANVAGTYVGTVTNNVFGGVNPVTRFVSQSLNLVKISTAPNVLINGNVSDLFELGPGSILTWLGQSGSTLFVVDPLLTAQAGYRCIDGQIIGNTINYRCVDTGQTFGGPGDDDSFVLTKQ